MTQAKRHLPGQVAFTTRRCTQRQFLLGPDTREMIGYFFGRAMNQTGCIPHSAIAMSNHIHYVYTDVDGKRSSLMQQMHSNVARHRNKQLNRSENLWDSTEPGDCALLDVETIVEKSLYTVLNAVAAGLIDSVQQWDGFLILPDHWGQQLTFKRPAGCGKSMPASVTFIPQPPPGFEDLTLEEIKQIFNDRIKDLEAYYRSLRTSVHSKPPEITPNMSGTSPEKRRINPRFACNGRLKAARALAHQRAFQRTYKACLGAFQRGQKNVTFPAGTVRMTKTFGIPSTSARRGDPHLVENHGMTRQINKRLSTWRVMLGAKLLKKRAEMRAIHKSVMSGNRQRHRAPSVRCRNLSPGNPRNGIGTSVESTRVLNRCEINPREACHENEVEPVVGRKIEVRANINVRLSDRFGK